MLLVLRAKPATAGTIDIVRNGILLNPMILSRAIILFDSKIEVCVTAY
jgi:hypothetical protein